MISAGVTMTDLVDSPEVEGEAVDEREDGESGEGPCGDEGCGCRGGGRGEV